MSDKPSSDLDYPLDIIPFEVFHEGSWHAADLISIQDGNISVRTKHPIPTMLDNIHTDFLRMRSRKATSLDCCTFLRPGIDVCALLPQPASSNSDHESEPQQLACLDGRIIKIKQSHDDTCKCLFAIMPYKNNGLIRKRTLVNDRASATLVTINHISILQKLNKKPDENGNIFPCSTQNRTSIYKTKLFNFTDTFSTEIATLLVFSTLGCVIEVKVVQDRIIYHVREEDVNQNGSIVNMKVVNFMNCGGIIKPKVERVSIEPTCKEEKNASTGGIEQSSVVSNANNVYEEMNIRRSKREKFQPIFFSSYTSPNFGRSSYAPSAKVFSLSKSQSKKEPVKEEVSLRKKHATKGSVNGKPKQKAVQKEKSYMPHEKLGAKVKHFNNKKCDGLKDELIKDQAMRKKKERLYEKHGVKRKHISTKECDDFVEELMTEIRCFMSKKAKPGFQLEEEACASAPGNYPIDENFVWSPINSDGEIEKENEKDEYEDLWEEMDYCLNTLVIEEKKMFDSEDEVASGKDKEELCVHDCVLNEQLGYVCIKCNVVLTEIRDIFPPMMKERSYRMLKDRANNEPKFYPFETDPSFLKTSPNTTQFKSSNNIWTPIIHIEPKLHPHQRKAFQFIWKNLTGSLEPEKMSSRNGNTGGCVISHSPGSGKTLTVITFLISHLAVFPKSHPLVLTPKSAIHTWQREFEKWGVEVPVHIIHQDIAYNRRTFVGKTKYHLDSHLRMSNKEIRIIDSLEKVRLWHENPGVLLMTYPSFHSIMKGESNEYYMFMANVLQTSPGLLVLDEGHNPRSTSSKVRKALMKVNTESRILLSGTVFQNNFEEYFNTLCLARPRFMRDVITELEPKKRATETKRGRKIKDQEKRAQKLFVEKIGHKIESRSRCARKHGFDLLRNITSGFINAFDGEKLQNLPGLETYTIFLQCSEPQEKVLQKLQNSCKNLFRYPLEIEFLVSVGAIHPCLVSTSKAAKTIFTEKELKEIGSKRSFYRGSKTLFVIDVIMKSLIRKERVLVFSHNIEPLKLLIKSIESCFGWGEGNEILFLYGDQDLSVRSEIIDKFNGDNEGKRKVLLASTNACAEGISLTAASRIVLLDSEWNPSKTKQAIARAFRPGQEKVVYAYLLLAAGSWEESKYEINKKKARMSKMVLLGTCVEDSSAEPVNVGGITDELLREIVEDNNKTVKMVVKH
ncbi:SNF2 domain-containing protein CLASSY 1-like isoform X2 [Carex rostrata]